MIKIAIASGKGGTGKTFVSTHLYHLMQEEGWHAGIVDCDAEVPNDALFFSLEVKKQWPVEVFCPSVNLAQCSFCGQCAANCHFHAITCIPSAHYLKVMPDLCHACTACQHFCPTGAIVPGKKEIGWVTVYGNEQGTCLYEARIKEGEHSPVPIIREVLRRAEAHQLDYLLLDAPPGCACPFVNTVKDADLVFLVTEPTPFGLSDLKHTVEVLRQLHKPFAVIINRADLGDDAMKSYLQTHRIPIAAEIPFSEQVAIAYSQGKLAIAQDQDLKMRFREVLLNIQSYESSSH